MSGKCTYFHVPVLLRARPPSPMSTMGMGSGMTTVSHQHGDAGARLWQTHGQQAGPQYRGISDTATSVISPSVMADQPTDVTRAAG